MNMDGEAQAGKKAVMGPPKYTVIDRAQGRFTTLQVDDLIGPEHPARLIWELVGRMDLSAFEKGIASREGGSGRSCWMPQLLISLLIYGYTRGVASARQLERMMAWEPGLRWLGGMEIVNHHTLSDFRLQERERLQELLTKVLALLAAEDQVDFAVLLQDGTKIKAAASRQSFRRQATLEQHLREAQTCVEELDRRAAAADAAENNGNKRTKKEAALERATRERLARMNAAMEELERRQAAAAAGKRDDIRISESEAEARKMKQTNGGFDPSYNVQFVTEGKNGFVVGVAVSNEPADQRQLVEAVAAAQSATGQAPQTVIADGGYASRDNVEQLAAQQIELVAPWKNDESREAGALAANKIAVDYAPSKFVTVEEGQALRCPAGKTLIQIGMGVRHGVPVQRYEGQREVCGVCPHKPQCCPSREARRVERVVESEAMKQYYQRMAQPETQQLYKKRSRIAEYVHMKIKSDWGLGRFRVRGLVKAGKEALWMAIAFNVQVMLTLRRQQAGLGQIAS
jgi:transposase